MPVFFVPPHCITPPDLSLTGALLAHLRDSLRAHVGDTILIGDGLGRRYRVSITGITKRELTGRILDSFLQPARNAPSIVLGQALLKGDKMDWVIQKATELGVQTIVPLQTRHSVVQPKAERIPAQVTRWQRIALEAAQQSEQWTVPTVAAPQPLAKYCDSTSSTLRLILAERREDSLSLDKVKLPQSPSDSVALLVGPEGGWTQDEVEAAEGSGHLPITLGPKILRAETAAIAVVAILQYRLGGLR
jgi:16S rRNA (uracil1498-N3)-methyltransferase